AGIKRALTPSCGLIWKLTNHQPFSWTGHNPLCPQAPAASRSGVVEAVGQVLARHLATAAVGARREGEAVDALAVFHVIRVEPQIDQVALLNAADNMPVGFTLVAAQISGMGVEQRRARADAAVPADDHRPALDECADVVRHP